MDGSYAMTIRFFDALSGGNEILVDSHSAVGVSNGLFNVAIGNGSVTDGSGPGVVTTLAGLFATDTDLFLEVEVQGETLSPRTPVHSTAFALNSRRVRGQEIVATGDLDLWVDGVSGSDDNDGLSLASAKATIQAAVDAIPPILAGNATVHVQPATYEEQVFVTSRLSSSGASPLITILGDELSPETVILDGTNLTSGEFEDGITISHAPTEIRGLRVTGFMPQSPGDELAGIRVVTGSEAGIRNCRIDGNSEGVSAGDGSFVGISDTLITGNAIALSSGTGSTIDVEEGTRIEGDMEARENSTMLFFPGCEIDASDLSCSAYSPFQQTCACTVTGGSTCSTDPLTGVSCCTNTACF